MHKKLFLALALLYWAGTVQSQVENRSGGWFGSVNSIHLKKNWGLQVDWALRTTDEWKYLQLFIFRTGITYRVSNHLTALVGYNHNYSRVSVGNVSGYASEHQVWQQLFIRHRSGPLFTTHRTLVEARFIPRTVASGNAVKTDGRSFAMRARYLFRNVLPFQKKPAFAKGPYAMMQQEILMNIGDNSAVNGKSFDQFRWLTGFGYRISPKMDVEAGYLYRDLATRSNLHYHDHVLQLNCFLRL